MTILMFLAAWALRSAAVVLTAAVLLALFRVKNPSVRLAAWTAALFGSWLIPALTLTLPAVKLPGVPGYQTSAVVKSLAFRNFGIAPRNPQLPGIAAPPGTFSARQPAPWPRLLLALYCLGAAVLLLRLVTGLVLSRRLIRESRPTGRSLLGGLPVHDSSELAVPAALGVLRSLVVLPRDWREWNAPQLEAILAHEQSHVRRHDPAVQLLSAIHRALLWYSPLSWWMHNRIVRVAEEASDDAALAAIKDRASYAETLLQFMQRGTKVAHWEGIAMARYGRADHRIQRILDGTTISRGLTRYGLAIILLFGTPVVFLAAAGAGPAQAPVTQYMIVSGQSLNGSWDSPEPFFKGWGSKYGSHYAWFRQDGREYIVNDDRTMAQLEEAMAPQREVNRHQEDVNRHQEVVNGQQEKVNRHQEDVNRAQEDVNQQQNLVNRGSGEQSRVNQLQSEVNGKQQAVNAEQDQVNQEQDVVNKEQDAVNRMQTRASAEIEKALQVLFDAARRHGLAHEVH
jgi:beta-lactamase regulating signal transducer with metallopeptidase domain